MPKLTVEGVGRFGGGSGTGAGGAREVAEPPVEGFGSVEVESGKRLVLAIEQDAKVDILHACGGNARCTTCRIEFISGEPPRLTMAGKSKMEEKGLTGVRLSCQIECDHDMTVRAISRLEGSGRPDPGPTPEPVITPPPVWVLFRIPNSEFDSLVPYSNRPASSFRKNWQSVTRPKAWRVPRSISFVIVSMLLSTQMICTDAGSRLPVATEWRVVATMIASPTPRMRSRIASCARTTSVM